LRNEFAVSGLSLYVKRIRVVAFWSSLLFLVVAIWFVRGYRRGSVDQSRAKAYKNWDPHDRVPETLLSSAARERGDKQFHDLLDRTLLDPSSFNIKFRSLSKLIQIHRSTDEKVRVFSWDAGGGTGRMVETWAQHTTRICSSCITNTIEACWLRGEKLMNRNSFNGNSMMIVDDCGGWNPDCTAVFDVPKK
jgi:hypothetical protein